MHGGSCWRFHPVAWNRLGFFVFFWGGCFLVFFFFFFLRQNSVSNSLRTLPLLLIVPATGEVYGRSASAQ